MFLQYIEIIVHARDKMFMCRVPTRLEARSLRTFCSIGETKPDIMFQGSGLLWDICKIASESS